MILACGNLRVEGTLMTGTTLIEQVASVQIPVGGIVQAGSSTIVVGGDWENRGTFRAGSGTVVFGDDCNRPLSALLGSATFHNLAFTSIQGKTFYLQSGATITITGKLSLQGTAGHSIGLATLTGEPATIILAPGATIENSYAVLNPSVRIDVQQDVYAITAVADPAGGGTVSCSPNPVKHGETSICTAAANKSYVFAKWGGNCMGQTGTMCTLSGVTTSQAVTGVFIDMNLVLPGRAGWRATLK